MTTFDRRIIELGHSGSAFSRSVQLNTIYEVYIKKFYRESLHSTVHDNKNHGVKIDRKDSYHVGVRCVPPATHPATLRPSCYTPATILIRGHNSQQIQGAEEFTPR